MDYKHATIRKYHKEGRALRTETTTKDTRDFSIGKRLVNLPALWEFGLKPTGACEASNDSITTRSPEPATCAISPDPVTEKGTRVPGLRLGQQRSHALLAALLIFRLQPDGFANRELRVIAAQLRGLAPELVSVGQMTYDPRPLRTHGLIEKIAHTHRYQVTDHDLHTAMFLTRVHDRLIPTGLAHVADQSTPGPLRTAATRAPDMVRAKPAALTV